MLGQSSANTKTFGDASYLDSPEVESTFLSAIGFQGANGNTRPSQGPATDSSPSIVRPQRSFADIVKGSEGAAGNSTATMSNARTRTVPVQRPNGSPAQNQGQVSSSQWRRTANEPQPLTSNYWEAQRVARGIANPSAYPRPRNQANTHQGRRNNDGPSEEFWGATTPQHFVQDSAPGRTRGPTANSNPRARANESGPTARPANAQPSSPSHPRQGATNAPPLPILTNSRVNNRGRRQNQPSTPPRLDQVEPDLFAYWAPRPNTDYAGSHYSLPSLTSSINVSDMGIAANGDKDAPSPDIRGKIGLKHNIHQSANGESWTKYNWANPSGQDDDHLFLDNSYLSPFIRAWLSDIPESPRVSFDQAGLDHWRRDIDTKTGKFLELVAQPESIANYAENETALEWRRMNWTSTLLMRRHNTNPPGNWRNGKNRRHGKNRRRNPRRAPEPDVYDEDMIVAVEPQEPPPERPEYNRYVPRIPCFLRPAEKFDMEAVRLIYNWEVEHGIQALDSQPLLVEDFKEILNTTQQQGLPFIVAVRGSARDLGLTKGNLNFSVFRQVPFTDKEKRGEILGFAYLSTWQPGLAGSNNGSSRATAKMHVFVHPDYRRKKIGFSLMDMLLTTVSHCFSSETGYDFIDPDDSPVYKLNKSPDARERLTYKVYVSFMVKHSLRTDRDWDKELEAEQKGYESDLVWVKKMLEDKLNFTQLVRFEAVHRSPKGEGKKVYWLDEVLFEHTCLFGPRDGRMREDY